MRPRDTVGDSVVEHQRVPIFSLAQSLLRVPKIPRCLDSRLTVHCSNASPHPPPSLAPKRDFSKPPLKHPVWEMLVNRYSKKSQSPTYIPCPGETVYPLQVNVNWIQKAKSLPGIMRPSQLPAGRFVYALSCALTSIWKYKLVNMKWALSNSLLDIIPHDPVLWPTMANFRYRYRRFMDDRYHRQLDQCHKKCSKLIVKRLKKLGGVYAKVGQFLLSFDHILPEFYMARLRSLADDLAPTSHCLSSLQDEIQSLGFSSLDEVFSYVSPTPFAVGSIAQVHIATIHGIENPVCLKIQHPQIVSQMGGDFKAIETIIKLIERFFPDLKMVSVFKRLNTALAQECNFRQEAFNSIRFQSLLASKLIRPSFQFGWDLPMYLIRWWNETAHSMPSVELRVPEVYWPLCTERVLVMEYVSNSAEKRADKFLKADDSDWARRVREHVADCYIDATSKMLFRIGLSIRIASTSFRFPSLRHAPGECTIPDESAVSGFPQWQCDRLHHRPRYDETNG
eukprot:GHVH01008783.1.p1 GENE.GHVH01008783.1~~GHVH01008783.1.p1  ORF type:complete len:508 (+),score=43.08 GHVH01008783.1:129-1652(+)